MSITSQQLWTGRIGEASPILTKNRDEDFFYPEASRLAWSGTLDLPDWWGLWQKFLRWIETRRHKSGKVEKSGEIKIISISPNFVDFFLVLRCPRKILTFYLIFEVIWGVEIQTYPDIYSLSYHSNRTTLTHDRCPQLFPTYLDFSQISLNYLDFDQTIWWSPSSLILCITPKCPTFI